MTARKPHPHGFRRFRPSPAELRAVLKAMPKDTRDVTAMFCGDPLFERSALAKKQATSEMKGDRHGENIG